MYRILLLVALSHPVLCDSHSTEDKDDGPPEWFFEVCNVVLCFAMLPVLFQLFFASRYLLTGQGMMGRLVCLLYWQNGWTIGLPRMSELFCYLVLLPELVGLAALSWIRTPVCQIIVALSVMWYLTWAVVVGVVKIFALRSWPPTQHDTYHFDLMVAAAFGVRLWYSELFLLTGGSHPGSDADSWGELGLLLAISGAAMGGLAFSLATAVVVRTKNGRCAHALRIVKGVVLHMDAIAASDEKIEDDPWPAGSAVPTGFELDPAVERLAVEELRNLKHARLPVVLVGTAFLFAGMGVGAISVAGGELLLWPVAGLLGASWVMVVIGWCTARRDGSRLGAVFGPAERGGGRNMKIIDAETES